MMTTDVADPVERCAGPMGVPGRAFLVDGHHGEENLSVRDDPGREALFGDIVGSSPALGAVLSLVAKVAPTDSTVLITGETGTGKELIARAIHRGSRRSEHPIISMNCAATPASLIATELFGHERGAFTGALQRRPGRFELAAGGTLFLDEVGELPTETQIALLRVLQEREFERVGGTTTIRANVRVVAATNRLNVFPIEVPPLRERREDIRVLVEVFLDRYARRARKVIRRIGKRTLDLLEAYPWPGNIRELQNVIERSVIMSESDVFSIDEGWLTRAAAGARPARQPLRAVQAQPSEFRPLASSQSTVTLEEVERDAILRALRSANWMVGGANGAAATLGLKRTTLQARMQKLGIPPPKSGGRQRPGLSASDARCFATSP
jgi:transcriptional regulator with GAF, ATPase, and Fis domain